MAGRPSLSTIPLLDLVLDTYLDNDDLADLLSGLGDLTSGTKPERIARLKQNKGFKPERALRNLSRAGLAELCRQRDRSDKGDPKALIRRLVDVIKTERSQLARNPPNPPQVQVWTWWQQIHPDIRLASEAIFEASRFAPSVLQAFITVNARVKEHVRASGSDPKEGTSLMRQALDVDHPLVRIPSPSVDSAEEIQEGYQHIFAGAMLAVRDPKAHQPFEITADQAMHLLFLASLLMRKLDEAGVP